MLFKSNIYKTEDRGKIYKNIYWGLAEKVLLLVSGVFVYAKVATYLGAEAFGHFNYILSVYNIFLPIASLGLSNIIVTKLLDNSVDKEKVMGTAALMRGIGALVAILTNAIFLYIVDRNVEYILLSLFMSWSYFFTVFSVLDDYFQSILLAKSISIIRMFVTSILIIFKLLAIYYQADLKVFLFIYSLDFVLAIGGLVIFYFVKGGKFAKWKFDLSVAKNLFKALVPILITLVADTLYTRYAVVVIKEQLNFSEVGIYSVAAKLGEVWYFIPVTLCIALFPKITKVFNDSKEYYKEIVEKVFSILFLIPLLIAIVAIIFVEPFIRILFDSSYLSSIPIFRVYVFIGLFISLKTLSQRLYILENVQKYLVIFSVLSSCLSIGLFYILIPLDGGIGAALAIIISQIFYVFIFPLFFKETRAQVLYIVNGILPWNYLKIKDLFIKK